jgi:hypothetical protein
VVFRTKDATGFFIIILLPFSHTILHTHNMNDLLDRPKIVWCGTIVICERMGIFFFGCESLQYHLSFFLFSASLYNLQLIN